MFSRALRQLHVFARSLIGSLPCLRPLWLARVITLVLILRLRTSSVPKISCNDDVTRTNPSSGSDWLVLNFRAQVKTNQWRWYRFLRIQSLASLNWGRVQRAKRGELLSQAGTSWGNHALFDIFVAYCLLMEAKPLCCPVEWV